MNHPHEHKTSTPNDGILSIQLLLCLTLIGIVVAAMWVLTVRSDVRALSAALAAEPATISMDDCIYFCDLSEQPVAAWEPRRCECGDRAASK